MMAMPAAGVDSSLPLDMIIQGDALTVLRTLPDASVDAVVTDPPYSSGGLFRADRLMPAREKYVQTQTRLVRPDFAGEMRDQRGYLAWCSVWLAMCMRVVKPGGVAIVFADWRQLPTTTDALQAGGFIYRGIAVWDKTEAARPLFGRFRNQCEYMVWGSNGKMALNNGRPCFPGVYRVAINQRDKHHVTGKPTDLMRALLQIVPSGGTVLDPFAGSGTTCVAARLEGRHYIGIEMQREYVDIARQRLGQAMPAHKTPASGAARDLWTPQTAPAESHDHESEAS